MPPLKTAAVKKSLVTSGTDNSSTKNMNTRNTRSISNSILKKENVKDVAPFSKRKAISPIKGNTLKRSALGNITNAIETQCVINSGKKVTKKAVSTVTKATSTVTKATISTTAKISHPTTTSKKNTQILKPRSPVLPQPNALKSMLPPLPKSRLTLPVKPITSEVPQPRPSLRLVRPTSIPPKPTVATVKPSVTAKQSPSAGKKASPTVPANKCKVTAKPKCMVNPNTRRSSGRRSTLDSDNSLYVSALSEMLDEEQVLESPVAIEQPKALPEPDINIDEEYAKDPYHCAIYAYDIFEYLKSREEHFRIDYYMDLQTSLNQHARAVLIDWMVEIQESFEMNHETLYLGVKLVDTYLSKIKVSKQCLQLVGATAMFIAAKYDERVPPGVEDFVYVCDDAYRKKDLIKMERNILKVIDFELGFPLSYRFLRRYARCAKIPMALLTLARYILEFTLMDYATVTLSESKMAAAALYIAFKMNKEHDWDNTLIYFSGYRVEEFIEIAYILNASLHQKPKPQLATVRNKYSHKIFHEVAKIPLVNNDDL